MPLHSPTVMRLGLIATVLVLLAAVEVREAPIVRAQAAPCSGPRADVQTLTDKDVSDIDGTQIIGVRVSALAQFPLPDQLPDRSRFNPYETTIYRTGAQLVRAHLGPNQEIELVVADPDTAQTITAVFPDAARCSQGADPVFLQLMQQARQQFVAAMGTPGAGAFSPLNGQAVMTGIGFIYQLGNGGDQAGIELSPVLDFQFVPTTAPVP